MIAAVAATTTTTTTTTTRTAPATTATPASTRVGEGTFSVQVPSGSAGDVGALRVRVLVERGLEADADEFLAFVEEVLGDADGWAGAGRSFVVVEEKGDLDVVLAKPKTVDALCAPLLTGGSFSCGRKGRAVINVRRWRHGATTFGKDLAAYRSYVINHELGHLLGFDHEACPGRGRRAPVMLQQTKSLAGCRRSSRPTHGELERLAARNAKAPARTPAAVASTPAVPVWDVGASGGAGRLGPP